MSTLNVTRSVKVAIIQHPPVFLNLTASLTKAATLVEEAAQAGARLVVFPETWLPGYPVWLDEAPNAALWGHRPAQALYQTLFDNSLTIPGPHLDQLRGMARQANAYLVMGAHERRGGTLYNTLLYLSPDGRYTLHRKLMPTYTERLVWGQGDGSTLGVVDTEWGPLGGLICWEHWMPLARAAMHAQGETIHIAQWPTVRELHQIASRHYAFEGQCFVLAAGTVLSRGDILNGYRSLGDPDPAVLELLATIPGADETLTQQGGSAVIAPDTSYVAGPVFERACILYADLDLTAITRGHLVMDSHGHYARPDIFQLEVNTAPQTGVVFK